MGNGPSVKETTMHHFRDPLLDAVSSDETLDLLGVMLFGASDDYTGKVLTGTRAAVWAQGMRADGAIVSTDGWGNTHVDYVNACEQLGRRGIAVAGLTFNGTEGRFVVTNDYLDAIVDVCKNEAGIETNVVGQNTMDAGDCRKVLALLKFKMRQRERGA